MSAHAASPRSPVGAPAPTRLSAARPWELSRAGAGTPVTVALAFVIAAVCFAANGGQQLGATTKVEIVCVIGAALGATAAALATPDRGRWWGAGSAALLFGLAGWTAASVTWAANGSDAWVEGNRTITYAVLFAAVLALVRAAPQRWPSVLGAIVLSGVVVCGWALLTKVFPGAFSQDELYARLRAPFGYWNATGLAAALAIPPALWLGARRQGHAALNALAQPAIGLLLLALLLSYSRGGLLALGLGLAFWFATVPLRLRGLAVLLGGAAGALPVAIWSFSQTALTTDNLATSLRAGAGHDLGLLLVAMVLFLVAVGLASGFVLAARPPGSEVRNAIGLSALVVLALVPVGFAGYLFTTSRGFTGSISHAFSTLADPHAASPPNDPGRLTAVGSVRSRYWNEALKMWLDHPVKGVGAEGYATVRPFYREDTLEVEHAHGYVVQTLADLGLVGAALSLALLAAWLAAALRATGLRRTDRGRPFGPERIGLLTMVSVVLIFGVSSFVDWTWFIPGNVIVALLCAAWVAGRGPLRDQARILDQPDPPLRGPRAWAVAGRPAISGAVVTVFAALIVAWVIWQPLRSLNASDAALAKLQRGDVAGAESAAIDAHDRNPLALDPLSVLALVQTKEHRLAQAEQTLQRETRLQPANSKTWLSLSDFQLNRLKQPQAALASVSNALYLDPRNPQVIGAYLVVRRAAAAK